MVNCCFCLFAGCIGYGLYVLDVLYVSLRNSVVLVLIDSFGIWFWLCLVFSC